MKQKGKLFVVLFICFIFLNLKPMWGQNVKFVEKIEFSSETELPLRPKAFCVTEDEVFIIPDYHEGNVKIFEKNGKVLEVVKAIGRKGYGPDEFSKPAFCFYNKDESKMGVMDLGIRKIFIYDRIRRIEFKRVKEISCWRGAYDIQLIKDRLFISGSEIAQNGRPYDFYYIDLNKDDEDPDQKILLLPSYKKYGFESYLEYETKYLNLNKPDFSAIGIMSWFDIFRDDAYFVWEGNLKVIKINTVSKVIEPKAFGNQLPHYVKPKASEGLIKERFKRDLNRMRSLKAEMSYVRDIFTTPNSVIVIYEGPIEQNGKSNFRMQFYSLEGEFKSEVQVPIPDQPYRIMWFDKDNNLLYSLLSNSNTERANFILKYKINE